jgi:hypothetical protein
MRRRTSHSDAVGAHGRGQRWVRCARCARAARLVAPALNTEPPRSNKLYAEFLHYLKWPQLRARAIIALTMELLPKLPRELNDLICRHTHDTKAVSTIIGRTVHFDASALSK